ncbi:hypothetical protein UlMin_012269 [Ulmus minor]
MASPAVAGASEENCNNNDSCIVEIPKELEPELTGTKNIIYRVPRNLRKLKEAAYTLLISIGPFHHGKRELQAMEQNKKYYHDRFFLTRTTKSHDDLKTFINDKCQEVCDSYAGTMKYDACLILIEACFIIELFLTNYKRKDGQEKKDYILRMEWLRKAIQLDLILLENQLPYFLLECLYHDIKPEDKCENGFLLLACSFFKEFCTRPGENVQNIFNKMKESDETTEGSGKKMKKIKHFTDLVRQLRLPINLQTNPFQSGDNHLYSTTELDKAGVKLTSKCCCLGLEVPALMLDDATELLFRNMIALEQCLYSDEAYICSYVALMSHLINTKEDADFLDEAGLFTRLSDEISFSNFCYASYCKRLNNHYEKWFNRTWTKGKKVYFNDLWKTSSTVVGFFVLIFTITSLVKTIF